MHVSVEKYNCVPRPRPSKAGGHALYVVKLKTTSPSAYRYSWSVAYACGNQRRAGHTIQWRDGETTLGVASSLICLCGSISPHRVSHTRVLIRPCVNFGLDFFQTKFTRSLRLTFQKKKLVHLLALRLTFPWCARECGLCDSWRADSARAWAGASYSGCRRAGRGPTDLRPRTIEWPPGWLAADRNGIGCDSNTRCRSPPLAFSVAKQSTTVPAAKFLLALAFTQNPE